MKTIQVGQAHLLAFALVGALAFSAAGAKNIEGDTLTIDGEIVSAAKELDLADETVTKVVLTNGGGVCFTNSITGGLTKTYSVAGEGVISVAAGKTVRAAKKEQMLMGTLGQKFIKRGGGKLQFIGGPGKVEVVTSWIVEEGELYLEGADYFGAHSSTTTNLTIDLREGALLTTDGCHCPMGPLVMTGATMNRTGNTLDGNWGNTAFRGGVLVHPSDTESRIIINGHAHLNHVNTDVPFVIEKGAVLNVRGRLSNGWNGPANARIANKLMVSGGGQLRLLSKSVYSGGTKLSDGVTLTIGDPEAIGTGGLEIDGTVTLEVLPGVKFTCPAVTGSGKIVKTGGGVATFPTVAAEVTVERAAGEGSLPDAFKDGTVYLNGASACIDVAAGQSVTVEGFASVAGVESKNTSIVKTGAGTLVLPQDASSHYGNLIVNGGFVDVTGEGNFGSEGATLQGGGLHILQSFNLSSKRITCVGSATLDIPAGVTFGIHSNCFVSAGATVTKTGAGTWKPTTQFRYDKGINFTGTRWIVHEGKFKFASGDNFNGHTGSCPLVLEAHEGTVLEIASGGDHLPLCNLVLRGATMYGFYSQFPGDANPLDGAAFWHGFGLNGPITVMPSSDGQPSRICARACHLAHGDDPAVRRTVFDVQDGATLEVDSILNAGWNGACTKRNYSGLVKRGGGTLKLLKQVGTQGTFDVLDGAVELGPKAALNANLRLNVSPNARFVLNDGSQLTAATDLTSSLLGTADVWFDASRLDLADGASVSSVPNFGTAGGSFKNVTCLNSYTPTAPTFKKDGIGGLGTLYFDGSQSLVTTAYTNFGPRVQVFLVSKWTSWANSGGKGLWGGPISLTAKSPSAVSTGGSGDDNQSSGALTYENWSGSLSDLQTCTLGGTLAINQSGIAVGTPYITHSYMNKDKNQMYSEVWRTAGCVAATNSAATGIYKCEIDTVCIGGRMRKGVPQIWGQDHKDNRQYIGQIGEVLVFTRELTADEIAAIYAYLEKKWFGVAMDDRGKEAASCLNVDVKEGGDASAVVNVASKTAIFNTLLSKGGEGTLRLGGALDGEAFVDVAEGGLAFKDGNLPPQVDIWVDASDNSGMTFDGAGRVTNLLNRGACGGSFVRNTRKSAVPTGPEWQENALNGRPALVFDGDSALALFSYVNKTSPRRLSVYCVGVRTRWELKPGVDNGGGWGKWAGPYSFGSCSAKDSDENVSGIVTVQEEPATQCWVDYGVNGTSRSSVPPTGEPYLMVFHCTTNGSFVAYETNKTDSAKVPRTTVNGQSNEPFNIDIVQLATRTTVDGGPQWWGHDNSNNRSWYGKIGEFIATTEPLSGDQERELFEYLRKKWFDKGNGTATPPAWLSGVPAAPTMGGQTTLTMADGTSLRHEAGCVTLGALATEGAVDWQRVWDGDDLATFPMFSVGDVSLGAVNFMPVPQVRKGTAKVLDYEATFAQPTWNVYRPDGKPRPAATVSDRANAYWLFDQMGSLLMLR